MAHKFCKYGTSLQKKILQISFGAQTKIFKRNLNVHEHVSYSLLNCYKIDTPKFKIASTPEECEKFTKELKTKNLVMKAQVLTGGRGVGKFKSGLRGGVKVIGSPEEAKELGSQMLKQILVTKQTGPGGLICNSVMIAERKFPRREYYFCIMMERSFNGPVIIASSQGGVSIEDVAEENPEAIIYEPIPIECGLSKETAIKIAKQVGLSHVQDKIADLLCNMYKLFCEKDALLVEINPYAEDAFEECSYFALDAKVGFDDNALFRQPEIFEQRDLTQIDPLELAANEVDMNYISLDGQIGCMVNGAGLAMATMDIIKLNGGDPANFLDVGGVGNVEATKKALGIITSNPNVNSIYINIFAGINRCDLIAEAIVAAVQEFNMQIPIVIRFQGNKAEEGKVIIKNSGLNVVSQNDFEQSARTVVVISQILEMAKKQNLSVSFRPLEISSNSNKGPKS